MSNDVTFNRQYHRILSEMAVSPVNINGGASSLQFDLHDLCGIVFCLKICQSVGKHQWNTSVAIKKVLRLLIPKMWYQ